MKSTIDLMTEEANENHLQNSENTTKSDVDTRTSGASSPSTDSFCSHEETFFQAIGTDFRTLAVSFKKTAGGVANFVQRSALNVAAEINRLEEDDVQAHLAQESMDRSGEDSPPLRLPWEVHCSTTTYEEDSQLREKILNISSDDDTFLKPIPTEDDGEENPEFCLDEPRIELIRRLLEIDDNLASTHARLSGRRDVYETAFWKNYFFRCEKLREEYLVDYGTEEMASLPSQDSLVPAEEDSLVPAEEESEDSCSKDGSSSFVIPSAPASGNSAGLGSVGSGSVGSVGSLVIVDSADCPSVP